MSACLTAAASRKPVSSRTSSLLPTPRNMAAGRDPVLAHAIELAGASLTPEEAGRLFK